MSQPFFPAIERIAYEGPGSDNPLAFRWYDPDRVVLGARLADHLRVAVCFWHSFCWDGTDMFGAATFSRPWLRGGDPMALAVRKVEVAFEFIAKLGVPFFTFHDRDVAPEGATLAASNANLARVAEHLAAAMQRSGVGLLWGTANLFSHRRYAAGAATNPDPEVFAYAAAQVKQAMDITRQLGGANYVLWGGREGYDSLLNTDMRRELEQLGRFMSLVVEYKHRSGFPGTLLIEPKPMEPAKHQYDHDAAAVHAFLRRFGLEGEIRLNIEANHATLAGHSFEHEVAYALAADLLGSVDINRGDPQNGWDTDQFPNSVEDLTMVLYRILASGGIAAGGFNFDARLRRQSIEPIDLFHAHIGGIDTLARAFLSAAALHESGVLAAEVHRRYAGWERPFAQAILRGEATLEGLTGQVISDGIDPKPRSGGQERLENLVLRFVHGAGRT